MTVQQTWSTLLGIFLLAIGIIGLLAGEVWGIIGANVWHNLLHVVSGVVLLWTGLSVNTPSHQVNTAFGVIYGLLGIIGFLRVLNIFFATTTTDHVLNLAVGVLSLAVGTLAD